TAVLVDEKDAEVGTFTGYSLIEEVPPGTRAPVSILIHDPPKHASIRYEFKPEQADYLPAAVKGLRVEALDPKRARFGGWKVEGKVISESEQSAKFVKIVIQAFDAKGKLIGAQSTYADDETLAPGGTARWQTLSMEIAGKPDHFEYSVSARVAE
ncbi:MAG: FxLYD domain-containing protein, partial [Myxococcales bacterium]|nr:FxLYD domain-containing protein [Myxococcales bacterium]